MRQRELRRVLKDRKKKLRVQLKDKEKEMREKTAAAEALQHDRVARLHHQRRKRMRRRGVEIFLVILVIAVLLLMKCSCEEGSIPPAKPEGTKASVKVRFTASPSPRPAPLRRPLPPLTGRLDEISRAEFDQGLEARHSWIDDFRIQVTSRGPRLSACFSGAVKPGTYRWTSSVNLTTGAVSDHNFEPLGATVEMTQTQQKCVTQVLVDPPYRLKKPDEVSNQEQSTPVRVSLVIEF